MRAVVYLTVTLATFFFLIGMWWTLRQIEQRRLWAPPPAEKIYILAPREFFKPAFKEALLEVKNIELLPLEYEQKIPDAEELRRLQIPPAAAILSGAQALELAQNSQLLPLPQNWTRWSQDLALDFRSDLGVGKDFKHFFPVAWEVLPGIDEKQEVLWLWVYGLALLRSDLSENEIKGVEKILKFLLSPAGNSLLVTKSPLSSTSGQVENLSSLSSEKKASHLRSQSLRQLRYPRSLPAGGN